MSYSSAAILELGRPLVVPDSKGAKAIPSVVSFAEGKVRVGVMAKRQAPVYPEYTVPEIKRLMGTGSKAKLPNGQEYTPQEISAFILKELVKQVEEATGKKVEAGVIGCPAAAPHNPRRALEDAAEIAGLKLLKIVNEPEAVAIAYSLDQREDGYIFIYDWGGSTKDISILRKKGSKLQVIATEGDMHLGGVDIDKAIKERFSKEFQGLDEASQTEKAKAEAYLLERAEQTKIDLSDEESVVVGVSLLGQAVDIKMTREELSAIYEPKLQQGLELCKKTLEKAKLSAQDIDYLVLAGAQTKAPIVKERLSSFFGKAPEKGTNPDFACCEGCLIKAAQLADLVVRSPEGKPLPAPELQSVLTYSVGVVIQENGKKSNYVVLPKGTAIPAVKQSVFTTVEDDQEQVEIIVLQGESENPEECQVVNKDGKCIFKGIPAMAKGQAKLTTEFSVGENGILMIRVVEEHSQVKDNFDVDISPLMSKVEKEAAKKKVQVSKKG